MVKLFVFLIRKKGITRQEFSRYWQNEHAEVVLRTFPEMKRYVQNHAIELSGQRDPPFDGIAESWFDDLESLRRAMDDYTNNKGKELREDEEKFLDRSRMPFFVCQERLIKAQKVNQWRGDYD